MFGLKKVKPGRCHLVTMGTRQGWGAGAEEFGFSAHRPGILKGSNDISHREAKKGERTAIAHEGDMGHGAGCEDRRAGDSGAAWLGHRVQHIVAAASVPSCPSSFQKRER